MKKLRKSLAVLLAVIMLATFMPLFASAATVAASKTNCTLIETPQFAYTDPATGVKTTTDATNTNLIVPVGITYDDIEVVGGKIEYNGTPVEGYFDWHSRYLTRKPTVGVETRYALYFYVTDTATYSNGAWAITDMTGWPTITVNGLTSVLAEKPVSSMIGIYSSLRTSTISGGKITDENGNDITSAGSWQWVNLNTTLDKEGTFEYEVKWTSRSGEYNHVITTIPVTAKMFKTTLAEAPTMSEVSVGGSSPSAKTSSKVTGGKVVDEDGNEVTGGVWSVTYPEGSGTYIYADMPVTLTWKKTGYQTITVDAVIPTVQTHANYNFEKAASLKLSGQTLTYSPDLTWESLEINEAVIKDKNGNIVEGTYSINHLPIETAVSSGVILANTKTKIIYIYFFPKDTTLPSVYFLDTLGVVNKANFTLSEDSELVLNYGTAYKTSYSEYNNDFRFSTLKTIPEEAGSQGIKYIKWAQADFDPSTADYGTVAMVQVTVIVENDNYANATVTLPVRIQPYTMSGNFNSESQNGVSIAVAHIIPADKDDGLISYIVEFTNKRLNGKVVITATDGTNNFDIATVTPDENNRFFVEDKWQAPADGTYAFIFTYVASENDTAVFANEANKTIVKSDINVDMKEFRTVTVKIGSTVYTEKVRESHAFTKIWSDITTADKSILDHWVITDVNGNEVELTDTTNAPFNATADTISLIMPEYDIIITAMSAQGEEVNEDGLGGSLWSFWQKLVNFIIEIYRTIVDFFVPAMEQI